jgi:hypothetical protein
MSVRTYTFGTTGAYRACLYHSQVLTPAAEAVYEVAGGASALADRADPLAATAVSAFLRGDAESGTHPPLHASPNEPYASRLHLLLAIANTQPAQDTAPVLDLETHLVDTHSRRHVLQRL